MKIFAVTGNWKKTEEISRDRQPAWYMMADSSILKSGNPFFVPDFDSEFTAYASIYYRIGRLGKSIAPRFASRYIDGWGMAFAIMATQRLKHLQEQGLPWAEAVSFDRSCLLGNLQPIDTLDNYEDLEIGCPEHCFSYNVSKLATPIEELISILSRDNTLKNGDLILASLSCDGITLTPGMRINATTQTLETNLIDFNIR